MFVIFVFLSFQDITSIYPMKYCFHPNQFHSRVYNRHTFLLSLIEFIMYRISCPKYAIIHAAYWPYLTKNSPCTYVTYVHKKLHLNCSVTIEWTLWLSTTPFSSIRKCATHNRGKNINWENRKFIQLYCVV